MAIDIVKFIKGLAIKNNTDTSKEMELTVSSAAATNTKTTLVADQQASQTLSLPDTGSTDVLVSRNSTDTLTNKTMSGADNSFSNIPGSALGPGVDASNIGAGTVNNTEFGYLDGVTSPIQTQLNAVAGSAITGLTGDVQATGPGVVNAIITNGAITNAKVDSGAQIDRTKLALGGANHVVTNDAFGNMTSELRLAKVRGGSGQDNTNLTFPTTGTLATTNQAETFTNKTIGDSLTFTQIATPAAPSVGFNKVYTKSDNRAYIMNAAGQEQRIGNDGGGTKNYLTQYRNNTGNGDFETGSLIGWNLFNTTLNANRIPNQASGLWNAASGSFSSSIVVSNISGAYSAQLTSLAASTAGDMFISDAFSIDDSDKNKLAEFSVNFRILSGLANLTLSGTSTSSLGVGIYDVTNGTWITPSGSFNFLASNPVGNVTGRFTTSPNGASYRIAIYFPNASAGAFALTVDDFEFGPVEIAGVGPMYSNDIGKVDAFAVSATTTIPGYLYCNGAAISRSQYAELFTRIGITHGAGDGSTTFNLPDYRGRFLRGQNNGSGNDPDSGSRTALNSGGSTGDNVGSLQSSQFGSHSHTDSGHSHVEQGTPGAAGGPQLAMRVDGANPASNTATSNSTASASANITASGGNETRPVNVNVNYFIKYTSTIVPSNTLVDDNVGKIDAFALAPSAQIPGYLYCNGAAVSRVTYSELFAKIGITHGSGDGTTTFNLPDYRGRFLRGQSDGTGRDPDTGSRTVMNTGGNTGDNVGSIQSSQYASHNHGISDPGHSHTGGEYTGLNLIGGTAPAYGARLPANPANNTGVSGTGVTVNANGGNETRPLNANVNYFIRFSPTIIANDAPRFSASAHAAAAVSAGVDFDLKFSVVEEIKNFTYNSVTGELTCLVPGNYDITWLASIVGTVGTTQATVSFLVKNNVASKAGTRVFGNGGSSTYTSQGSLASVPLSTSDVIKIAVNCEANVNVQTSGLYNYVSISKV